MSFNDFQLGFIYRFKKRMSPVDMGQVMGVGKQSVEKAIFLMRSVKRDKYPVSDQERLAKEYMKTRFDSEILAFAFAFDACLDIPGATNLYKELK